MTSAIKLTTPNEFETVDIPLSAIDNGLEALSVTFGWVLHPSLDFDPARLDDALKSVVVKWRLLAGRLVHDDERKVWKLRVPLGPLPPNYQTHRFTTSSLPQTLSYDSTLFTSSSAISIPRPPLALFRDSQTPGGFSFPSIAECNTQHARSKAPLLSLDVTILQDATMIGLSCPHGVMDMRGFGNVLRFLQAEMAGIAWNPPPLEATNLVTAALSARAGRRKKETSEMAPVMRDFGTGTTPMFRLLKKVLYEFWWQKAITKGMFLGKEVLEHIVKPVKEKVRQQDEWVSSYDVMVAWILKAAYLGEQASKNTLAAALYYSAASTLDIPTTYLHNTLMTYHLPYLPISSLSNISLADLAFLHRQALTASRTVEHINAVLDWTKVNVHGLPDPKGGKDLWWITSQSIAKPTEMKWGKEGETASDYWYYEVPFDIDHSFTLSEFKGGYKVVGTTRLSRWKSIEAELEKLNRGEPSLVV